MVKIRLSRGGVKNKPYYRIVATDSKNKSKGKYLELIGYWQPSKDTKVIDKEKVDKWLKSGAQISPAVMKLMEEKQ